MCSVVCVSGAGKALCVACTCVKCVSTMYLYVDGNVST